MTVNVVHLSTFDRGGSGAGSRRLHAGMLKAGHNSTLICMHLDKRYDPAERVFQMGRDMTTPPEALSLRNLPILEQEYWQIQKSRDGQAERFSSGRGLYNPAELDLVRNADVIQLNWTDGFIDLDRFLSCQIKAAIYFTFHDMSLFTGGCHYSLGCQSYKNQCGACYQLRSENVKDLSHEIWVRKKTHFNKKALHLIAPSKWIADVAMESSIFRNNHVSVIPHGIDRNNYKIMNKAECRQKFGIDPEIPVIVCGAEYSTLRKGFSYITEALKLLCLRIPEVKVLFIGRMPQALARELPVQVITTGYISEPSGMATCYNAGDIYLSGALEEAFGFMSVEAMACGLPVVAFDTCGISEIVDSGSNGILVQDFDVERMAEVAFYLLSNEQDRFKMAKQAVATERFDIADQVDAYISLYQTNLYKC